MPTVGNCGYPMGTNIFLTSSTIYLIDAVFSFSNWVKITQIGVGFYKGSGSASITFYCVLYKRAATPEGGTACWQSSLQSRSWSDQYAITHDIPVEIYLSPGKYQLAILVCSASNAGLGSQEGGTYLGCYSKSVSDCSKPPSPLAPLTYRNSGNYRCCITYETVPLTELNVNANVGAPFKITGSLYGLEDSYFTPFSTSFPTGSTFQLVAPESFNALDFELIGPSSVAVANHSYAIRWQDKVFYANGYYWVFWTDDDAKMYYKSSLDGINWGPKTLITPVLYKYGEVAGVIYDGTYFHIHWKEGTRLYLGIFKPESNGTLTMKSQSWQEMHNAFCPGEPSPSPLTDHSYDFSPDGGAMNVWHYSKTGYISGLQMRYRNDPHDVTSDYKWTAGACVPGTIAAYDFRGNLVLALPEKKFLVLATKIQETMKEYLWNGTSWGSQKTVTETGTVCQYPYGGEQWAYSAVVDSAGNVHLTYLNSSYEVRYCKRDYATNSWYPEKVLWKGFRYDHDTRIVLDPVTNDLYVFIAHAPSTNHIGLIKYDASQGSWSSMVDLVNEETNGLSTRTNSDDWGGLINADRKVRSDIISLIYITNNPGGGHLIKFLGLKLKRYKKWKWRQWEDGSTNRTRTIVLTGSTYTMNFDPYLCFSDQLRLKTLLRAWYHYLVIKPRGVISFEATKEISPELTVLLDRILNRLTRPLNEFLAVTSSILSIVSLIVYKFKAYLLIGKQFIRVIYKKIARGKVREGPG